MIDLLKVQPKKIGLRNVHQQLISLFGPPSGIYLESDVGKGTKASMILPLIFKSREEHR